MGVLETVNHKLHMEDILRWKWKRASGRREKILKAVLLISGRGFCLRLNLRGPIKL